MTVTHPLAERDADPAAVTGPDGGTYPVDDDGAIDCPEDVEEEIAEALADHYDVDVAGLLDGGVEPGDTVCTCDVDDACDKCGGRCPTVKTDGDVCGRERPCSYHDETED